MRLRILALLVPYIAMIFGLYVFHSAWIAFVIYHVLILVVMASFKKLYYWKRLFEGGNSLFISLSILFGIGGGVLIYLLNPVLGLESYISSALASFGLFGSSWLVFVFYHGFVNPWFEEAYWRGFLGDKGGKLVFNDLVFAAYHVLVLVLFLQWYWVLLAFFILLLAAWVWRQLAIRCKGLLVPVLSHMAADVSIMFVIYLLSI